MTNKSDSTRREAYKDMGNTGSEGAVSFFKEFKDLIVWFYKYIKAKIKKETPKKDEL